MSEKKCPFLYDGCMCSIPECGEHCPERIKFPDGRGGFDACPYSKEARDIIEAVLEGAEIKRQKGHDFYDVYEIWHRQGG